MNPLIKEMRLASTHIGGPQIIVAGQGNETCLDKFFRQQLKFSVTGEDIDREITPVLNVEFAQELRKFNSSGHHVVLPPGTAIIPARRDAFGMIVSNATSALQSELHVNLEQIWVPRAPKYEDFAFIVFRMHSSGRGWEHAFFVHRRDVLIVMESE